MEMDNELSNRNTQSILFGEIPLNSTDTTNYSMKRPDSNGSATVVEMKNHINSMKIISNGNDTSSVIDIDMDGELTLFSSFFFIIIYIFVNKTFGKVSLVDTFKFKLF